MSCVLLHARTCLPANPHSSAPFAELNLVTRVRGRCSARSRNVRWFHFRPLGLGYRISALGGRHNKARPAIPSQAAASDAPPEKFNSVDGRKDWAVSAVKSVVRMLTLTALVANTSLLRSKLAAGREPSAVPEPDKTSDGSSPLRSARHIDSLAFASVVSFIGWPFRVVDNLLFPDSPIVGSDFPSTSRKVDIVAASMQPVQSTEEVGVAADVATPAAEPTSIADTQFASDVIKQPAPRYLAPAADDTLVDSRQDAAVPFSYTPLSKNHLSRQDVEQDLQDMQGLLKERLSLERLQQDLQNIQALMTNHFFTEDLQHDLSGVKGVVYSGVAPAVRALETTKGWAKDTMKELQLCAPPGGAGQLVAETVQGPSALIFAIGMGLWFMMVIMTKACEVFISLRRFFGGSNNQEATPSKSGFATPSAPTSAGSLSSNSWMHADIMQPFQAKLSIASPATGGSDPAPTLKKVAPVPSVDPKVLQPAPLTPPGSVAGLTLEPLASQTTSIVGTSAASEAAAAAAPPAEPQLASEGTEAAVDLAAVAEHTACLPPGQQTVAAAMAERGFSTSPSFEEIVFSEAWQAAPVSAPIMARLAVRGPSHSVEPPAPPPDPAMRPRRPPPPIDPTQTMEDLLEQRGVDGELTVQRAMSDPLMHINRVPWLLAAWSKEQRKARPQGQDSAPGLAEADPKPRPSSINVADAMDMTVADYMALKGVDLGVSSSIRTVAMDPWYNIMRVPSIFSGLAAYDRARAGPSKAGDAGECEKGADKAAEDAPAKEPEPTVEEYLAMKGVDTRMSLCHVAVDPWFQVMRVPNMLRGLIAADRASQAIAAAPIPLPPAADAGPALAATPAELPTAEVPVVLAQAGVAAADAGPAPATTPAELPAAEVKVAAVPAQAGVAVADADSAREPKVGAVSAPEDTSVAEPEPTVAAAAVPEVAAVVEEVPTAVDAPAAAVPLLRRRPGRNDVVLDVANAPQGLFLAVSMSEPPYLCMFAAPHRAAVRKRLTAELESEVRALVAGILSKQASLAGVVEVVEHLRDRGLLDLPMSVTEACEELPVVYEPVLSRRPLPADPATAAALQHSFRLRLANCAWHVDFYLEQKAARLAAEAAELAEQAVAVPAEAARVEAAEGEAELAEAEAPKAEAARAEAEAAQAAAAQAEAARAEAAQAEVEAAESEAARAEVEAAETEAATRAVAARVESARAGAARALAAQLEAVRARTARAVLVQAKAVLAEIKAGNAEAAEVEATAQAQPQANAVGAVGAEAAEALEPPLEPSEPADTAALAEAQSSLFEPARAKSIDSATSVDEAEPTPAKSVDTATRVEEALSGAGGVVVDGAAPVQSKAAAAIASWIDLVLANVLAMLHRRLQGHLRRTVLSCWAERSWAPPTSTPAAVSELESRALDNGVVELRPDLHSAAKATVQQLHSVASEIGHLPANVVAQRVLGGMSRDLRCALELQKLRVEEQVRGMAAELAAEYEVRQAAIAREAQAAAEAAEAGAAEAEQRAREVDNPVRGATADMADGLASEVVVAAEVAAAFAEEAMKVETSKLVVLSPLESSAPLEAEEAKAEEAKAASPSTSDEPIVAKDGEELSTAVVNTPDAAVLDASPSVPDAASRPLTCTAPPPMQQRRKLPRKYLRQDEMVVSDERAAAFARQVLASKVARRVSELLAPFVARSGLSPTEAQEAVRPRLEELPAGLQAELDSLAALWSSGNAQPLSQWLASPAVSQQVDIAVWQRAWETLQHLILSSDSRRQSGVEQPVQGLEPWLETQSGLDHAPLSQPNVAPPAPAPAVGLVIPVADADVPVAVADAPPPVADCSAEIDAPPPPAAPIAEEQSGSGEAVAPAPAPSLGPDQSRTALGRPQAVANEDKGNSAKDVDELTSSFRPVRTPFRIKLEVPTPAALPRRERLARAVALQRLQRNALAQEALTPLRCRPVGKRQHKLWCELRAVLSVLQETRDQVEEAQSELKMQQRFRTAHGMTAEDGELFPGSHVTEQRLSWAQERSEGFLHQAEALMYKLRLTPAEAWAVLHIGSDAVDEILAPKVGGPSAGVAGTLLPVLGTEPGGAADASPAVGGASSGVWVPGVELPRTVIQPAKPEIDDLSASMDDDLDRLQAVAVEHILRGGSSSSKAPKAADLPAGKPASVANDPVPTAPEALVPVAPDASASPQVPMAILQQAPAPVSVPVPGQAPAPVPVPIPEQAPAPGPVPVPVQTPAATFVEAPPAADAAVVEDPFLHEFVGPVNADISIASIQAGAPAAAVVSGPPIPKALLPSATEDGVQQALRRSLLRMLAGSFRDDETLAQLQQLRRGVKSDEERAKLREGLKKQLRQLIAEILQGKDGNSVVLPWPPGKAPVDSVILAADTQPAAVAAADAALITDMGADAAVIADAAAVVLPKSGPSALHSAALVSLVLSWSAGVSSFAAPAAAAAVAADPVQGGQAAVSETQQGPQEMPDAPVVAAGLGAGVEAEDDPLAYTTAFAHGEAFRLAAAAEAEAAAEAAAVPEVETAGPEAEAWAAASSTLPPDAHDDTLAYTSILANPVGEDWVVGFEPPLVGHLFSDNVANGIAAPVGAAPAADRASSLPLGELPARLWEDYVVGAEPAPSPPAALAVDPTAAVAASTAKAGSDALSAAVGEVAAVEAPIAEKPTPIDAAQVVDTVVEAVLASLAPAASDESAAGERTRPRAVMMTAHGPVPVVVGEPLPSAIEKGTVPAPAEVEARSFGDPAQDHSKDAKGDFATSAADADADGGVTTGQAVAQDPHQLEVNWVFGGTPVAAQQWETTAADLKELLEPVVERIVTGQSAPASAARDGAAAPPSAATTALSRGRAVTDVTSTAEKPASWKFSLAEAEQVRATPSGPPVKGTAPQAQTLSEPLADAAQHTGPSAAPAPQAKTAEPRKGDVDWVLVSKEGEVKRSGGTMGKGSIAAVEASAKAAGTEARTDALKGIEMEVVRAQQEFRSAERRVEDAIRRETQKAVQRVEEQIQEEVNSKLRDVQQRVNDSIADDIDRKINSPLPDNGSSRNKFSTIFGSLKDQVKALARELGERIDDDFDDRYGTGSAARSPPPPPAPAQAPEAQTTASPPAPVAAAAEAQSAPRSHRLLGMNRVGRTLRVEIPGAAGPVNRTWPAGNGPRTTRGDAGGDAKGRTITVDFSAARSAAAKALEIPRGGATSATGTPGAAPVTDGVAAAGVGTGGVFTVDFPAGAASTAGGAAPGSGGAGRVISVDFPAGAAVQPSALKRGVPPPHTGASASAGRVIVVESASKARGRRVLDASLGPTNDVKSGAHVVSRPAQAPTLTTPAGTRAVIVEGPPASAAPRGHVVQVDMPGPWAGPNGGAKAARRVRVEGGEGARVIRVEFPQKGGNGTDRAPHEGTEEPKRPAPGTRRPGDVDME